MKKLCNLFTILTILTSLTTLPALSAGIASGGQVVQPPATAPAPTPAPDSTPAPTPPPAPDVKEVKEAKDAKEVKDVKEKNPSTPSSLSSPSQKPHQCGEKTTLEERVKCRLEADPATLQLEHDTAYFPEGCHRGSTDWQEACKARYKMIGPCWYDDKNLSGDKYAFGEVDSCLKSKLKLPEEIVPVSEYCANKGSSCSDDYRKAVYNLIIARFYDAEQRAEILYQNKKISEQDTIDFVTFISEAKISFYDAKSKDERVKVIQNVISKWQQLVKKINS